MWSLPQLLYSACSTRAARDSREMNRRGYFPENLIYKQPVGLSVLTPGLGERGDAEKTLRVQKRKHTQEGGGIIIIPI